MASCMNGDPCRSGSGKEQQRAAKSSYSWPTLERRFPGVKSAVEIAGERLVGLRRRDNVAESPVFVAGSGEVRPNMTAPLVTAAATRVGNMLWHRSPNLWERRRQVWKTVHGCQLTSREDLINDRPSAVRGGRRQAHQGGGRACDPTRCSSTVSRPRRFVSAWLPRVANFAVVGGCEARKGSRPGSFFGRPMGHKWSPKTGELAMTKWLMCCQFNDLCLREEVVTFHM